MRKFCYKKLRVKFTRDKGDCYIYSNKGELISHFNAVDGMNFWDEDYTPFSLDGSKLLS